MSSSTSLRVRRPERPRTAWMLATLCVCLFVTNVRAQLPSSFDVEDFSAIGSIFVRESTGYVGIGTTYNASSPPTALLEVDGATKLRGTIEVLAEDGGSSSFVINDGLTSALEFRSPTGTKYLTFETTSGNERVVVDKPIYFNQEIHLIDNQDLNITGDSVLGSGTEDTVDIFGNINASLPDNTNNGFQLFEGSNNYLTVDTVDGQEQIELHVETLISDATASNSVSTGSLVVAGGMGVSGSVNIGASTSVAHTLTGSLTHTLPDNTASVYTIVDDGSTPLTYMTFSSVDTAPSITVGLTTTSTATNEGALIVSGGVGINENLYMGGNLDVAGNTVLGAATSNTITSRGTLTHTLPATATSASSFVETSNTYLEFDTQNAAVKVGQDFDVAGNTVLGDATTDTITSQGTLTHTLPASATSASSFVETSNTYLEFDTQNAAVKVGQDFDVAGNTVLGDATTDTITSQGTLTHTLPASATSASSFVETSNTYLEFDTQNAAVKVGQDFDVAGNTVLGDATTDTITSQGTLTHTLPASATSASSFVETSNTYLEFDTQNAAVKVGQDFDVAGNTVLGDATTDTITSQGTLTHTLPASATSASSFVETSNTYLEFDTQNAAVKVGQDFDVAGNTVLGDATTDTITSQGTLTHTLPASATSASSFVETSNTYLEFDTQNAAVKVGQDFDVAGNTVLGDATTDTITSQGTLTHTLPDNTGGASSIQEGTGSPTTYLSFDTTDTQEAVKVELTTTSTATNEGALIVSGGVGIAENLNVGGNTVLGAATSNTITSQGTVTHTLPDNTASVYTIVDDGSTPLTYMTFSSVDTAPSITVGLTTTSTATNEGALIVSGGVGIAENLNVGGNTVLGAATSNTITSQGTVTHTLPDNTASVYTIVDDGSTPLTYMTFSSVDTAPSITVGLTTTSTATNEGALIVSGGVGIAENLNVGGNTVLGAATSNTITSRGTVTHTLPDNTASVYTIVDDGSTPLTYMTFSSVDTAPSITVGLTTTSTATNEGALIVSGGVGINENLYMGGNLDVAGNTVLGAATSNTITSRGTLTHTLPATATSASSFVETSNTYLEFDTQNAAVKVGQDFDVAGNTVLGDATTDTITSQGTLTHTLPASATSASSFVETSNTYLEFDTQNAAVKVGQDFDVAGNTVLGDATTDTITSQGTLTHTLPASATSASSFVETSNTYLEFDTQNAAVKVGQDFDVAGNTVLGDATTDTITSQGTLTHTLPASATSASSFVETSNTYLEFDTQNAAVKVGQDFDVAGNTVLGDATTDTITSQGTLTHTLPASATSASSFVETSNTYLEFDTQNAAVKVGQDFDVAGNTVLGDATTDTITSQGTLTHTLPASATSASSFVETSNTYLEFDTQNAAVKVGQDFDVAGNTVLGDATTDTITSQGTLTHTLPDNTGGASSIQEGTGSPTTYLSFDTTDTQEAVKVELTTTSTATNEGALIVSGGVGIAENLNVGGNTVLGAATSNTITSQGTVTHTLPDNTASVYTIVDDGSTPLTYMTFSSVDTAPSITVGLTTTSTATNEGALIVSGGVGIAENLNVGGNTVLGAATSNTITSQGTVTHTLPDNTASVYTIVDDGSTPLTYMTFSSVDTAPSITVGLTTTSTATNEGALIVSGGVGINENLYMGGNLDVAGNTVLGAATSNTITSRGTLTHTLPATATSASSFVETSNTYLEFDTQNAAVKVGQDFDVAGNTVLGDATTDTITSQGTLTHTLPASATSASSFVETSNTYLEFDTQNAAVKVGQDFDVAGNTVLGDATTDTITSQGTLTHTLPASATSASSFVETSNTYLEFDTQNAAVKVGQDFDVAGNTVLGDATTDTITSQGTLTHTLPASATSASSFVETSNTYLEFDTQNAAVKVGQDFDVAGNTVLGDATTDTITSQGTLTHTLPASATSASSFVETSNTYLEFDTQNAAVKVGQDFDVAGNTVLGDATTDTITSQGTLTHTLPASATSASSFVETSNTYLEFDTQNAAVKVGQDFDVAGNTVLGDATTDTITSQGTLTHTLPDNTGGASSIQEGTGSPTTYLSFDTTDTQEAVKVELTTTSTATNEGALIVSGGVGIAENLYVGGNVVVTGTVTSSGSGRRRSRRLQDLFSSEFSDSFVDEKKDKFSDISYPVGEYDLTRRENQPYVVPYLHVGASLDIGSGLHELMTDDGSEADLDYSLIPHQTVTSGNAQLHALSFDDIMTISVPHMGAAYVRITVVSRRKVGSTVVPFVDVGELRLSNPMVEDDIAALGKSRSLSSPRSALESTDGTTDTSSSSIEILSRVDRGASNGGDWVFTVRLRGGDALDESALSSIVTTVEGTFRRAALLSPKLANDKSAISPSS